MAREKMTLVADTGGVITKSAARDIGVEILGMLRKMVNPDGTFKDPAIQAKFEKFCIEEGY